MYNDEQTDFSNVQFEKVTGGRVDEFWKPTVPGTQIVGKYVGSFDSNFGKCYMLEDERGNVWGLPSHTILQGVMANEKKIKVGYIVRVTYDGMQPNKTNQPTAQYTVEAAPAPASKAAE